MESIEFRNNPREETADEARAAGMSFVLTANDWQAGKLLVAWMARGYAFGRQRSKMRSARRVL